MNDLVLEAKKVLLTHRTNIIEDNMDNIRDWIKFSCDRCGSKLHNVRILTMGFEEYVAQAHTYLLSGYHSILFFRLVQTPQLYVKRLERDYYS